MLDEWLYNLSADLNKNLPVLFVVVSDYVANDDSIV